METTQTHLSELALRFPAASRLFHRHRIDFCCGGKRPLAEACRERGLDADALLDEIRATPQAATAASWAEIVPAALVEHIMRRFHEPLPAELEELVAMAEKVERVHGEKPTCPRGLGAHLRELRRALLDHMQKEELVLFPAIRAGRADGSLVTVQALEQEHRDVALALQRTRALTSDATPPPEACTTWRALYMRLVELEGELMEHMHLENNVLFPGVLARAS